MQTEKIKTIAAITIILGAVAFLYFSLREAPPEVDPRPQEALGQVLAEEAGKLLGSGGRLTLITRGPARFEKSASEFQMKGFEQALHKSNLNLAATNVFKVDPLRLLRVPPGDFLEVLKKQSENDVIVSLLGPPVLTSEQRARLSEKRARVVAVCSGGMPRQVNLRALFDQNLLHVAILSRAQTAPNLTAPNNLREWFDHFYQVVTRTNISDLPVFTNNVAR